MTRVARHRLQKHRRKYPLSGLLRATITFIGIVFAPASWVLASPESLFLVVNADSWSSLSIANAYAQSRGIPDSHICAIPWKHGVEWIDDRTFQAELLKPVFEEIRARQLTGQIRYLVYSSDFPTVVDFSARSKAGDAFPQGSLTGLTFLHKQLTDPALTFVQMNSNDYAMATAKAGTPLGFESYLQLPGKAPSGLPDHLISTMLGYTAGRGNSYAEVLSCLRSASSADGTHPVGDFCFLKNPDIRSTTRSPRFATIVSALTRAGASAEIITGNVPPGPRDISGVMLGTSDFTWHPQARILPGAICDNLTSYGAIFAEKSQQTPISVFVRSGATGCSGTVVEPYAIPQKFPDPVIHLHYRLGCTLGEAFYLAVAAPYQLLILGDPLCRPYGIIPQVELAGIQPNQVCTDTITLTPRGIAAGQVETDEVKLYLDGKFLQSVRPGESFNLECKRHPAGQHLISAVAYEKSSFRSYGRREVPVTFAPNGATVECRAVGPDMIRWGDRVPIEIQSNGCDRVEVRHFGTTLATWRAAAPNIELDSRKLGLGTIALTAVGIKGRQEIVRSECEPLQIAPPKVLAPRAAGPLPVANLVPGLILRGGAGLQQAITETTPATWLESAGIPADGAFSIEGFFRSDEADLYQFRASLQGHVTLRINGQNIYAGDAKTLRYGIPVHLTRGTYDVECHVKLKGIPRARLEFDNQGSRTMSSYRFQHLP